MSQERFTPRDLLDFTFVGDPQLSPAGDSVAYVKTTIEPETNEYTAGIFVVPFGGGEPTAYTSGLYRDSLPRWSPDGQYLAFLSNRDVGAGKEEKEKAYGAQLYIMPRCGGEARRVTDIKGGIVEFAWAPDANSIAFRSMVSQEAGPEFLDQREEEDDNEQDRLEELFEKFNEDVKHIDRIAYRYDGKGYLEDRRSQVFVLELDEELVRGTASELPTPRQVTSGDYDHVHLAWSPDSTRIAVSACREEDSDQKRFEDLWVFDVSGEEEPLQLTRSVGPVGPAAWSLDGSQIAYLGHARESSWYTNSKVWLVEADGSGEPTCLTADFNRSFGDQSITDMRMQSGTPDLVWAPGGDAVYVSASDRGRTHLYRVDMESGDIEQLTRGDIVVFGYDIAPDSKRAVCAVARAANPNDIYGLDFSTDGDCELEQLTAVNQELLASRKVSLPERYSFSAEDGPEVDGWAIRPVGFEEGEKYPTVLQIHGGPMAMYNSGFFFEFQLLAAAGMGVIYTNPRGSQGYGEDFCAAIAGDWGTVDYQDVMAGVDAALAQFDWIDADRLGVAGGSYGGYMTSWVIGHTDRFQAACSMRPVNNCYSFFGTSDGGYMWDEVYGEEEPPWENPDEYLRQSPLSYVGNVTTPTLIIHSENDYRCRPEQAEQFYIALKKQGIETEFLRYPDESHGLSRGGQPWHRIHRLKHIIEWFERFLKK